MVTKRMRPRNQFYTRVDTMPVPVPYSPPFESAALPSRDDIQAAIHDMLKESL